MSSAMLTRQQVQDTLHPADRGVLDFTARVKGLDDGAALQLLGPTLRVRIWGPSTFLDVHALIDSGGEISGIEKSVAQRLGLRPYATRPLRGAFSGGDTPVYRLRVALLDGAGHVFEALTLGELAQLDFGDKPRWGFAVGRDILRHYVFAMNGPTGRFVLARA